MKFLADRTRLNVALTRAKYSLIILLNVNSLETNIDWRACINDARQRGVLYDVSSAKHLSQIFLKNDTLETEHLPKFGASTSTHHTLSRKEVLPSHASVKSDKASASSSSANVSSEKTCTADILPSYASAQSDNASTADILPSHLSVPNVNTSNEQISSSDEFDFDDHEPDIGRSHGNDEIPSDGQLYSKSADCDANKSLISGELVDLVVHCGESIQAQRNPYMQQLVQHERVDKLIRN